MIFLEIMVAFPQIDGATRFQMLTIEGGTCWRNEDTRSSVEEDFRCFRFEKPIVVGHRHRIDIARRAGDREFVGELVNRFPVFRTGAEWALVGPLIPLAKRGGNKRVVDEREIVNGLMYILSTGCQWASLPKDLPPRSTVNDYFRHWDEDGTLARIHHAFYVKCRELAAREASPTAAMVACYS
jgi:transposase